MQIDCKFQYKGLFGPKPELIMRIVLLPRGSGNRNKARRLAESFKTDKHLAAHIGKVVTGTTSITVHMPITGDMAQAVNAYLAESKEQAEQAKLNLPGQLPLAFG